MTSMARAKSHSRHLRDRIYLTHTCSVESMNSAALVSARFGSTAVIRAAAAFPPPRSDATALVAPPDSFRAASELVAFGFITLTVKARTCGHRIAAGSAGQPSSSLYIL